jgi:hypothetical protein
VEPRPQLALVLRDRESIESVARMMTAASSGLEVKAGTELPSVLKAVTPNLLQLLVCDMNRAPPGALETVASVCPQTKFVAITSQLDDGLLTTAQRLPNHVGFVARTDGKMRPWELSYVVRRVTAPQQAVPASHQLLTWGATSRTFKVRDGHRRDQVVQAVDLAASWCGVTLRAAELAGEAALELLNNALVHGPPPGGERAKAEVLLRMTVDDTCLAIDVTDPWGRLTREQLHASLEQGRADPRATGFSRLFSTAGILRVEVVPNRLTLVSWVLDRGVGKRTQAKSRSLYFLAGA